MGARVNYSVEELRKAVIPSICFSDVCKELNITVCTFNIKRVRVLCSENEIDVSHFDMQSAVRRGKFEWKFENVFCEHSTLPRHRLRAMAIRFDLFKGACECCGLSEWLGSPITIELDHINGICDDNRTSNLRWLCPNCHSQTETFRNPLNRRKGSFSTK